MRKSLVPSLSLVPRADHAIRRDVTPPSLCDYAHYTPIQRYARIKYMANREEIERTLERRVSGLTSGR